MRTAVIPFILALAGCAPGMYTAGALPAAAVAVLSPVRDANGPVGEPYPISHGIFHETGRAQLPASGPLWSLAPQQTPQAGPVCAEPPPSWLSAPPWQRGVGGDSAVGGCAPRL
ncbi:hypothetical protein [Azospirillum sp. sgz301742]